MCEIFNGAIYNMAENFGDKKVSHCYSDVLGLPIYFKRKQLVVLKRRRLFSIVFKFKIFQSPAHARKKIASKTIRNVCRQDNRS